MKERIVAYLQLIWPTVYRVINNGLYWIYSVIRSGIRIAMDQFKGL